MTKKVLIITHSGDNNCVETVSQAIRDLGGEAIRLDVDLFPTEISVTSSFENGQRQIWLDKGEERYALHECESLWFRRFYDAGKGLIAELDEEYLRAALEESRRTLTGLIEGFPQFRLSTYSQFRRLDSKEEQMKFAARCGLLFPDTCISNSAERVREFIRRHNGRVITKMQSGFAIYREGVEHVVFTNRVSESDLEDMDSLQLTPMVFQQEIEKKLELRVTIVGKKIFTFSIDSQVSERAQVDWRKDGSNMVADWKPYTLPAEMEEKLLRFMDCYGVDYGAIDIILSPDDQYYFLEINSAGEFFWLDLLCNYDISAQFAKVLLGLAERRGN